MLPIGAKVLEVGCGAGQFVKYLLEKGFKAEGIDLSIEMIKIAKKKVSTGKFQVMDMRNLKFKDDSFDGIMAPFSLIHIPSSQIAKTLKEFARVLSNNGFLFIAAQTGKADTIIDEPFMPGKKMFNNFFTKERVENYIKNAGFQIIHYDEVKVEDIDNVMSNKVIYVTARKE